MLVIKFSITTLLSASSRAALLPARLESHTGIRMLSTALASKRYQWIAAAVTGRYVLSCHSQWASVPVSHLRMAGWLGVPFRLALGS